MADVSPTDAPSVKDGKLVSGRITDKTQSAIEHGVLSKVSAIVVHQTGAATAGSSFSAYEDGGNGAHFLIDTDGTIYQTARINQKCWHVGNIQSRCKVLKTCSSEELTEINAILFKKNESYRVRVKNLSNHEGDKAYPDRYPTNSDSIGVELVGNFDKKTKTYDTVTKDQNDSLRWLLTALESVLVLTDSDVYRHSEVAYKEPSEAKTAKWK